MRQERECFYLDNLGYFTVCIRGNRICRLSIAQRGRQTNHTRYKGFLESIIHGKKAPKAMLDLSWAGNFQKIVYKIVSKIPYGKTLAYSDVAGKLRTSSRAVARALSKNRIPVLIPCHRVIRKDGTPAGYNQRTWIKKKLLLIELSASHSLQSFLH